MKIINYLIRLIIILLLISCSKQEKISVVQEKNIETQMIEAFKEGYEELENGDVLFAAKNSMRQNFYTLNLIGRLKQL